MLSNAYLLAKFRFDTAENERNFAEILPKTDIYLTDPVPVSIRCSEDRAGLHAAAGAAAPPAPVRTREELFDALPNVAGPILGSTRS